MNRNIVLIGFMGTGKTTVGQALARTLGYPHLDTDELIERRAGQSIPDLFAREGEAAFRDCEEAALASLHAHQHHLISTGGGIVLREANRRLLPQLGYIVWLQATPEEIERRTARSSHRPLLNLPNPLEHIRTLLDQREPLYREVAHLPLDTTGLSSDEIVSGILSSARYHLSQQDPSPPHV